PSVADAEALLHFLDEARTAASVLRAGEQRAREAAIAAQQAEVVAATGERSWHDLCRMLGVPADAPATARNAAAARAERRREIERCETRMASLAPSLAISDVATHRERLEELERRLSTLPPAGDGDATPDPDLPTSAYHDRLAALRDEGRVCAAERARLLARV